MSSAARSDSTQLQPAGGQGWYYARTPMLLLDRQGRIVHVNAACRQLLGLQAAGSKGRHYSELELRLGAVIEGQLFSPRGLARRYFAVAATEPLILHTEDLSAFVSECSFHSNRFGWVRLRTCEVASINFETGCCAGSSVSLEIVEIGDFAAFREALDLVLRHELMWDVYASSYDRILPQLSFYQEVVERHVQALCAEQVETILDVGAGTGTVTVR